MKLKEKSIKVYLKLNIEKTKNMASSPFPSWQIDREIMEALRDFILGGSKITGHCNCSHEIKRQLLLGRKAMTNLNIILKSRELTLPRKVHLVNTMVFLVVMYGCESWTIKKAEHGRIDAFELWCWSAGGSPQKGRGSGTSLSKAEESPGEVSLLSTNPAPEQARDNQT